MLTDEFESPRDIRERVASEAKQLVGADDAFFFNYVVVDGENVIANMCGETTREVGKGLAQFDNCPTVVDHMWKPSMVASEERNRFQDICSELSYLQTTNAIVYSKFYGPLEVTRKCRTRLYDGDRFLGYLGLARRGPNSQPFSRDELTMLDGHVEHFKSQILCAERLDPTCIQPAYAVFTRDCKKLAFATTGLRHWVSADRLSQLRAALGNADEIPDLLVFDSKILRFTELHGDDGPRVMVSVEHAPQPRIDPHAELTPAQRVVADFAIEGATSQEIADHLDLSVETIKTHLKNIYKRLGVASRLELSHRLSRQR